MWPVYPNVFSLDHAYKEAAVKFGDDRRHYSIQTQKMVADENGHLKELHTIRMKKKKDENGNEFFKDIPGTEKGWPA